MKLIKVTYYCPGCRKRIDRMASRRSPFRLSYCLTAGKTVRMRKLKAQP